MMRLQLTIAAFLFQTLASHAQDNRASNLTAFEGLWKEDLSLTTRRLDDIDRTYQQTSDGRMNVTVGTGKDAYHDNFKVDGKPCPVTAHPGQMQIWTHPDAATWDSTVTQNGKLSYKVHRVVSSDGRTLTFETAVKTRAGKTAIHKVLFHRTSSEKSGLVGVWKPYSDTIDTPDIVDIQVTPEGGITVSGVFSKYAVKPDGKATPIEGDQSVSLRLLAQRTLEFTLYFKGKPSEIDTFTLSSDGRSINEVDTDPETGQQTGTSVYRKTH